MKKKGGVGGPLLPRPVERLARYRPDKGVEGGVKNEIKNKNTQKGITERPDRRGVVVGWLMD